MKKERDSFFNEVVPEGFEEEFRVLNHWGSEFCYSGEMAKNAGYTDTDCEGKSWHDLNGTIRRLK